MEAHNPNQLAEQAKSAYQGGEFKKAADLFEAAASGFKAQDDAGSVAEMSNNQSVALLQSGDAEAALAATLNTDKVFEELGDTKRQAMALGNQAAALEALERVQEAEQGYQHSAELLKAVGEDELYATVMQSISAIQMRTGRQIEALASMQAGVDNAKKPSLWQRFLKRLLQIPMRLLNR
ncbi:MAG: hypothetical protein DWQ07_12530 [Chloroflexi bacterium]|nr:MAG: hypothetical protein DWQ07_12530 [Chloroflexota bacterium]MBL1196865.1 hypothetical protein [Chloroflexota bacterium]NOH14161.1 hypothetical protein [Chloroflexota bacterium]